MLRSEYRMWKAIKSNLGFSLFLLLFIILSLLFLVGILTSENTVSVYEKTEQNVVNKFSQKGLYFGPQYFVESEEGLPNRVSKKEIYNLQIGDTYTVYGDKLSPGDLLLGGIISLFFIGLVLFIIYILASTIFHDTKLFIWLEDRMKMDGKWSKKLGKIVKKAAIIVIVAAMIMTILLIGKNAFFKVLPYGKTEVEAEIIDREEDEIRSPKSIIKTYTLTLQYKDEAGTLYETEKDVTGTTYDLYASETFIPITYRNHHPFDTFIGDQSFMEFISPIFRWESIFLATIIYLTYLIIRNMSKKRGRA